MDEKIPVQSSILNYLNGALMGAHKSIEKINLLIINYLKSKFEVCRDHIQLSWLASAESTKNP